MAAVTVLTSTFLKFPSLGGAWFTVWQEHSPGSPRQAVVVIHGIGEQLPMGTLRSFVRGVIGPNGVYRNKPDRMGETLELRRLALPRVRGRRPATDFYELYWAHHSPEGSAWNSALWMLRLLGRRSAWRSSSLSLLFTLIHMLLAAVAVGAVLYSINGVMRHGVDGWVTHLPYWVTPVGAVSAWGIGWLLRRPIVDAVRYLTPVPDSIEARQAIRTDGLSLMRRLHADDRYTRVIVVGHSLGSVIGYDVLRLYWDEARLPDHPAWIGQMVARNFPEVTRDLLADPTQENVESYQQLQHALWQESRQAGIPWLVTDFVTIGSPLTYGELLLGTRETSLEQKQKEREYPTCPPVMDEESHSCFYPVRRCGPVPSEILVGHSAAPFSSTRWTNLYMPTRLILGGDLVGGPLKTAFGSGIRDVPVGIGQARRGYRQWFPFAHISYWWTPSKPAPARALRHADSLEALRAALALDDFIASR